MKRQRNEGTKANARNGERQGENERKRGQEKA